MSDESRNIQTGTRARCICDTHEKEPTQAETAVLREVLGAVRRIRHGQVQIHIQDGRVVQIDNMEKFRLGG